jgi:hypothetical protein
MGCINRDKNTVLNMERIVSELIKSGKRLPILNREHNRHYPSGTTMSDAKGTNRELKTKSTIKRSRSIKKVNTNQKEKKRNRNQ